jgi:hypothetical protein
MAIEWKRMPNCPTAIQCDAAEWCQGGCHKPGRQEHNAVMEAIRPSYGESDGQEHGEIMRAIRGGD